MTETLTREGIVEIVGANAVWMDPVAVLNSGYSDYEVSHERYFSRSFVKQQSFPRAATGLESADKGSRKRKRKKHTYIPNQKEKLAELRHQDSRLVILNAHSMFMATTYQKISSRLAIDRCSNLQCTGSMDMSSSIRDGAEDYQVNFLKLAEVWQAPLYELNILNRRSGIIGGPENGTKEKMPNTYQLFNAIIENEDEEAIAECTGASFILPRQCRFLISDIAQVHQLIPDDNSNYGYNLIMIDPPWENRSVLRKALYVFSSLTLDASASFNHVSLGRYPTIPNRQLLSLPLKRFVCSEGALVVLWLTNREKLQQFVERELFPAWGVKYAATWYWLKLNGSGEMISPLDLQHHKPYECLLLGYVSCESQETSSSQEADKSTARVIHGSEPPNKFVVMSIPGDHSRKPPMSSLLAQYAPGPQPIKGLELFARELTTGWTSWGNEPLHFQNFNYFEKKAASLDCRENFRCPKG